MQDLVGEILLRASEGQYGFDHLQRSTSRMHRFFKPFTEQTIFLLKRILQDLLNPETPMSSEHVRTVTKILSSNQMSELLFTSYGEAVQVLTPIVDSLQNDF